MATAEEILRAAFASESITVDWDTRTLIIPPSLDHIGVESDDDVLKVPFILPRYYGDLDIYNFEVNINYTNANGDDDVYNPDLIATGDENIRFYWLVGRYAAMAAGNVKFSLCLKRYNESDRSIVEQELNTQPAEIKVLKGHETTKAVVQQHPDVLVQMCDIINSLTERVVRLEKFVGFGDTYGNSKITFEDGVLIISPGGPGGSDGSDTPVYPEYPEHPSEPDDPYVPEEPPITYSLFGKWVFNENIIFSEDEMSVVNTNMKTGSSYGVKVTKIEFDNNQIVYVMSGKRTVVGDDDGWTENGYRYIDFGEEAITVDAAFYGWFTLNATEYVDVDAGETYRLYISNGYGTSIYVNGNEDAPMMVTSTEVSECRNVRRFKFTTDNVEFSFVSGSPFDSNGVIIALEPDEDGWYTLTQNTTVKVTAGGEYSRRVTNNLVNCTTDNGVRATMLGGPYKATLNTLDGYYIASVTVIMNGVDVTAGAYLNGVISIPEVTGDIVITANGVLFTGKKYQLYVLSPLASYAYINLDDTKPVAIASGTTNIHAVSKIKFAGANIRRVSLYSGIGTESFVDSKLLKLEPDENGWYTLTEDTSALLEAKDIDPDALMLYSKWIFNETVELPEKIVSMSGEQIFTGPGFGEIITQIAAHKGVGMLFGNADTGTSIEVINENGEWADVRYRAVDFGNAGEAVDEAFYRWMMLNAVNDESEYVSIVTNLTDCTSSNNIIGAVKGGSYATLLNAPENYELTSVTVTMDGKDVTREVYSVGLILIPEITGDIVITAEARKYYIIKGKWMLNSTVYFKDRLGNPITLIQLDSTSAPYLKTGSNYEMNLTGIWIDVLGIYYWIDGTRVEVCKNPNGQYEARAISNSAYRYLDFGSTGVKLNESQYTWFAENAQQRS